MKSARILKIILVASGLSVGCTQQSGGGVESQLPPIGVNQDGVVVRSRATVQISTGQQISLLDYILPRAYASTNVISVVNSPNSVLVVDDTAFIAPAISTGLLNFGRLTVTDLFDNNLDLCGPSANQHCGTAMIRIYTTGTSGEGLYNSAGGYGLPITATPSGGSAVSVGLDPAGAAVMSSINLPSTQHVVNFSDLVDRDYDFEIDFSNAGAGSYSTTVVVEYVLAP